MQRQQGFILVTVLWMLALMTVAASFFALWTERSLNLLQQQDSALQGEIDMYSTEATLRYLFATQTYTLGGLTIPQPMISQRTFSIEELQALMADPNYSDDMLFGNTTSEATGNEIQLDDHAYYGIGQARFAIQDESSLISLVTPSAGALENLLALLDVPSSQRSPLIAKLLDYNDIDNFHRINGAENYHYQAANRAPPRNRWLLHPLEARRVLDWDQYPQIWQTGLWQQVTTTARVRQFNFNAAPPLVMQVRYGLSAEVANRLYQLREQAPFYDYSDVIQRGEVVLPVEPMDLHLFYSQNMRITLWHESANIMRQLHIIITPIADKQAPWLVNYVLQSPLATPYRTAPLNHAKTTFFDPTPLSTNPQ